MPCAGGEHEAPRPARPRLVGQPTLDNGTPSRGRVPLASCFVPRMQTRQARNPDQAVLLERAHLRDGACSNPLARRSVDLLQRRDCQRDVLADHLPILLGRSSHEFDCDVPFGNVAQPRALVQGTDVSRGHAPEHVRTVRVGGRHRRLGRDCLHGDRRPWVFVGLDPHRRAKTSARLEHTHEFGRRLGHVGEEHVPETHRDCVERAVVERQIIGAAHLRLDVGDSLRPSSPAAMSSISGTRSVSTTRPFGDSRAMLKPGSPVPEAMSRCRWSSAMSRRPIIAAPTGPSCSMMTESHFSQPAESPAHDAR